MGKSIYRSLLRSLTFALAIGGGALSAQQWAPPGFAPGSPQPQFAPNNPAQQPIAAVNDQPLLPDDPMVQMAELRRRLAWCEAQLQANGVPPAGANGPVPANVAGYGGVLPAPQTPAGGVTVASPPAEVPLGEIVDGQPVPIISGPTLHVGGKAILDNAFFQQNPANVKSVGTEPDLTGFRFLRLMFYGDLYENINYRLEVDMAQAQSSTNPSLLAAFQDTWINFRQLPVMGNLKIGYFKEPFGLEQQTGEEYLLFMERSLANAFVPARHMGMMAYNDFNEEKTWSWFCGTFREGSGDKTFLEYSDEGDYGVTGRMVWLPYYDKTTDGRYLAHLGGAYEFTGANTSNADSKTFTFTPEVNALLPFGTATIPCDDFQLYGCEAAIMNGPLLFMAEYMAAAVPGLNRVNYFLDGGYIELLYLLTGENHNYNLPGKFFQGVTPYEPFFRVRGDDRGFCTGWGAWEVGARLSFIDLNDKGLGDGDAVDYTLGLHWYMTNNCSVMFNFIRSDLDKKNVDSWCNIYGTRVEFHF